MLRFHAQIVSSPAPAIPHLGGGRRPASLLV